MRTRHFMLAAILAAAATVIACANRDGDPQVQPDAAPSGEVVQIFFDGVDLSKLDSLQVHFGGEKAAVVRVPDSATVDVLVPHLPNGRVSVTVRNGSRRLGAARFVVLPPPYLRLFFTIHRDVVTFVRARPYNGHPTPFVESGRRLAFDLEDSEGVILASGAIAHPIESRVEIYNSPEPGQIRTAPAKGPQMFTLKIPYTTGLIRMRFFEAPDGLDLSRSDARAKRRPLNTVEFRN